MKILSFANFLSTQSPNLARKFKDSELLIISALEDNYLNSSFIRCEIGAINYVLALIAQRICPDLAWLDTGELSGESNVGEEEIEEIVKFLGECELIVVDDSINFHPDCNNIKALLAQISEHFGIKIIDLDERELKFETRKIKELTNLANFDGSVVYEMHGNEFLIGGECFAMVAKIKDGDLVEIKTDSLNLRRRFKLDTSLKGTVGLLEVDEIASYPFEVAKIKSL